MFGFLGKTRPWAPAAIRSHWEERTAALYSSAAAMRSRASKRSVSRALVRNTIRSSWRKKLPRTTRLFSSEHSSSARYR